MISNLKAREAMPKHMEIAKLRDFTLVSAYDEKASNMITESASLGMDTNPDLAVIKCLMEMIERKAFQEGHRQGLRACQTKRSDGFAAYPRAFSLNDNSHALARQKAYNEAVERYVWATWWDNPQYSHFLLERPNLESPTFAVLEEIDRLTPITKLVQVSPHFICREDLGLFLFFAFLQNGGVITGGACGELENAALTKQRAMGELFRHSLGLYRNTVRGIPAKTFYEKRLVWFGRGKGKDIIRKRLYPKDNVANPIILPKLAIDEEVPHSIDDLAIVHRCLFENQPPFVGGELARACL